MKIRMRVQKLDRPELVAYDRMLKRYGSACYPQGLEEREDYWRVPIGAYLQTKVVDEKTEKERILTFNLQNVGEVLVRKATMKVLSATPLRSLGKNILRRRIEIRSAVERDLIKIFGKKEMDIRFGQLKYAFSSLQPIYRTISNLLLEKYPSYDELVGVAPYYLEQVELLVDTGYAEYTDRDPKMLVATNKLKELFDLEKEMAKTIDAVMGVVISQFYYDLQKGRRIAQFVPYVRASTAYYGDAIQFGKLISIKENSLRESMREYYRGAPLPSRLRYAYPTLVRELVDAKILDYDGDYIRGRDKIFGELIDVRNELPMNEEDLYNG